MACSILNDKFLDFAQYQYNSIIQMEMQMNLQIQQLATKSISITLHCDIQPLEVCLTCLTGIVIVLIQIYALYLFGKEVMNITQKFYDTLDILIVLFTFLSIIVDLVAIIMFKEIGNAFSLSCKIMWTFLIVLVFFKFQFQNLRLKLAIAILSVVLLSDLAFCIYKFKLIPIRTMLTIQTFIVVGIAINQIYKISMLLTPKKTQINISPNSPIIPLLNAPPVYQKVIKIDPQTQAHLHNRRSFCILISASLLISLAFLWDLTQSKDGIGQILIVVLVQMLPLGISWLYLRKKQDQKRNSQLSVSSKRSSHIQMINIQN